MIVKTMRPREITEDQRRRSLNFLNAGASIRQAAALSGASISDVTAWRDEAATATSTRVESQVANLATWQTASPELQQSIRRVRSGPRKPVFVNGVRLGRLALWT